MPEAKDEPGASRAVTDFGHMIRDPVYRTRLDADWNRELTLEDIRTLVEQLLHEDPCAAPDLLEQAGKRAIPALLEALKDDRFLRETDDGYCDSPFDRVMELLERHAPSEAVPLLVPLLDHNDYFLRAHVAGLLASIGSDECIQPVLNALCDKESHVREHVGYGIKEAITSERATDRFKTAAFEALTNLINPCDDGCVPMALLAIDAELATELLLGEDCFNSNNEGLHYILRVLNEAGIRVPGERAFEVLVAIRRDRTKYPFNYTYGELLNVLAGAKHPKAQSLIRDAFKLKNETIYEAAAEALLRLHDVADPNKAVWDLAEQVGFQRLTQPQQHFVAVMVLKGEVGNGGYQQFYFNSSGELVYDALEALRAIGAEHAAAITERTMKAFGKHGPARNTDKRHRQLENMTEAQQCVLLEADVPFYKDQDRVIVKLYEYVVRHKDGFTDTATTG